MNKIICYINSNYIDIKKDNKIYHIISNSIEKGEIINSSLFINDLKSKRIFTSIISYELELYINYLVNEKERIYYNSIFYELNCSKIKIYPTSNKMNKDTLINCYPLYIIYYKHNYYYVNSSKIDTFVKAYKVSKLNVLSDKKINECNSCRYYYYNNYETYFLD